MTNRIFDYVAFSQKLSAISVIVDSFSSRSLLFASSWFLFASLLTITGSPKIKTAFVKG